MKPKQISSVSSLLTTMFSLSFMTASVQGLVPGEVDCSPDLLELVGEEVMECVRKQQEIGAQAAEAEMFRGEVYRQEGVCIMINRIINKCGSMWRNCYTEYEVKEMQGLQLLELREQYQDRVDYSKCIESLDVMEDDLTDNDISINETDMLSAVNNTDNEVYSEIDNEDIYEYNIVFDTIDDVPAVEGQHPQNCDQTSCQVEVNNDSNNDDRPGFFGSITKLLQPLFTLDL